MSSTRFPVSAPGVGSPSAARTPLSPVGAAAPQSTAAASETRVAPADGTSPAHLPVSAASSAPPEKAASPGSVSAASSAPPEKAASPGSVSAASSASPSKSHVWKRKALLKKENCALCGRLILAMYHQLLKCSQCSASIHHRCLPVLSATPGVLLCDAAAQLTPAASPLTAPGAAWTDKDVMFPGLQATSEPFPTTLNRGEPGGGMPTAPRLLVFANTRSGAGQGAVLAAQFTDFAKSTSCPWEDVFVHDLAKGPPSELFKALPGGPSSLFEIATDPASVSATRVLVCGGDGTVLWVLSSILQAHADLASSGNALVMHPHCVGPAIGIVPLGTGNDTSRTLGWGGSFTSKCLPAKLAPLFVRAPVINFDVWHVTAVKPSDDGVDSVDVAALASIPSAPSNASMSSESAKVGGFEGWPARADVFLNYFSIGMDANVALAFHEARENDKLTFGKRLGRIGNKLDYARLAPKAAATCKELRHHLILDVSHDGGSSWHRVEWPPGGDVGNIIFVNIVSAWGGVNLWSKPSSGIQKSIGMGIQSVNDGLLECLWVDGRNHLTAISIKARDPLRIAQAAAFRLTTLTELPMQMDGEPFMAPPVTLFIGRLQFPGMRMLANPKGQPHPAALGLTV